LKNWSAVQWLAVRPEAEENTTGDGLGRSAAAAVPISEWGGAQAKRQAKRSVRASIGDRPVASFQEQTTV